MMVSGNHQFGSVPCVAKKFHTQWVGNLLPMGERMFDTHINRTDAFQFHTHTVTEKRAPTDDSIRLVREFEQKAEDRWTNSMRLDSTVMDGIIHSYHDSLRCQMVYAIIININGKNIRVDHSISTMSFKTVEENIGDLITAVSSRLACELVAPSFSKIAW